MDYVTISKQEISVEEIAAQASSPDCGAISLFIGTTRNHVQAKKVVHLVYEAYEPMAVKEMKKICDEMRQKWPIKHVIMVHRVGAVPIREASVVIAVSSEHRQEAQQAVMWAVDSLKARVPIWKKEYYEDGEKVWKENRECPWRSSSP
ncbi:molybdopterin synthase catalytic subunit-like [Tachypleus tridentatus]|uniref:molybdopterin synthase catalytic subunit-like n=1 Tax=Tachypleus tridentatus TaxID=6853 RepID=UPI003FD014AC